MLNTDIYLAPDGKPVFSATIDKKGTSKLGVLSNAIKGADIYGQDIEKIDYGFVAYYRVSYNFSLANVPSYVPSKFVFSADLPGKITKMKGGSFQESKAIWQLEVGKDVDVYAESKIVRWWLIVLTLLVTIVLLYVIIATRWRKKA